MKVVIVDDENNSRIALNQKLHDYCPQVTEIKIANNAQEGIAIIESFKPHIVFLDIEMPRMNGFELLNNLTEKNFHLIFTTAYDQYAIKAIKYAAFDYLLKPIDIEELKTAVDKIEKLDSIFTHQQINNLQENIKNRKKQFNKLAIPTMEGLVFYDLNDVIHLESNSNYTNVFLTDGSKILASKTLKEFEDLLTESTFYRTHQSHLVNLNFIKKYIKGDGGQIEMKNGDIIDISRRKKDEFLKILGC